MTEINSKITTPIAIIIAGSLIAIAIIAAGYFGFFGNNNETIPDNSTNLESLREISDDDHIRGSIDKAEIIVLEYSDLECPYCKSFHETLNQLRDTYTDEEFAWVFRHAPLDSLHAQARQEAEAAECVADIAGEDAFWNYIDKIYATTTSNDGLDLSLLPQFAEEVGADKQEFNKCLESGRTADIVQRDLDNALEATGGKIGTPFSIIILKDGQKFELGGALPFEALKQGIDSILAGALDQNNQ